MRVEMFIASLFSLIFFSSACVANDGTIKHQLEVQITPQTHQLKVSDKITLPTGTPRKIVFSLHKGLAPRIIDQNISLQPLHSDDPMSSQFTIELPADIDRFTIEYSGQINHPLDAYGAEQARGFRNTPGLISEDGVYLAGSSFWYPQFSGQARIQFTLNIHLPEGWHAVSQGESQSTSNNDSTAISSWNSSTPQEEIYLIAARFKQYSRQTGELSAQVFLREADEKLANRYLDATAKYLQMYQTLLGPYPYGKFALIENFWETGFGMPSFTLLGSKVIRLPFIINSSYPHEILHNWWGNGVYVDYEGGNWSEGLTAYLADHLIKEQQGKASAYRQQGLQKYADYAANNRDFPLNEFRGRHSSASEAVGYGKTLMLMHMLRQKLGDKIFTQALGQFYQQHKFKNASFSDLQAAFEQASGKSLSIVFEQWVNRTGAPELQLTEAKHEPCGEEYCLQFSLQQPQSGAAYELEIPIAITLAGREQTQQSVISMQQKQQSYRFVLPVEAERLDIDPDFDLFRKLAQAETPPAFTQLFGARKMLVILPSEADDEMKTAWQGFADDLARMGPDQVNIIWDQELDTLPNDQAVTVLGWDNLHGDTLNHTIEDFGARVQLLSIDIAGKQTPRHHHAIAHVTRFNGQPRAFIGADLASSLPGLGRKLPHYHKYSYLAFSGEEPQNQLKGRWPVNQSPMTALFIPHAKRGKLAEHSALISAPAPYSAERMLQTIVDLTHDDFQGRGFAEPGLEKAADYIADAFAKAGLQPGGDAQDSYFQHWQDKGGAPQHEVQLKNVIGILPGSDKNSTKSVVIGAHYDHLGTGWPDVRADNQGEIHPGADDNASGVAVMLELARVLRDQLDVERDIVFVAFSGEEAGRRGSKYYLQNKAAKPPFAMLNLDTVGRLGDKKLLVLGAESADEWPHIFRGIGFVTGIDIATVNEALDASDQISFHAAGIPAVQLFSGANPDYHRPTDTAEKIDTQGLVKVAIVAKEVLEYLAGRKPPMTVRLETMTQGGNQDAATPAQSSRKVSLGSIPDFGYQGKGYRLDGVVPNSPAALAGLVKGDIIIEMNHAKISGLRDVSDILKQLHAGQKLPITYLQQGQEKTTIATLESK